MTLKNAISGVSGVSLQIRKSPIRARVGESLRKYATYATYATRRDRESKEGERRGISPIVSALDRMPTSRNILSIQKKLVDKYVTLMGRQKAPSEVKKTRDKRSRTKARKPFAPGVPKMSRHLAPEEKKATEEVSLTPIGKLHQSFSESCIASGEYASSKRVFSDEVASRGFRRKETTGGVRVLRSIRFRPLPMVLKTMISGVSGVSFQIRKSPIRARVGKSFRKYATYATRRDRENKASWRKRGSDSGCRELVRGAENSLYKRCRDVNTTVENGKRGRGVKFHQPSQP